MTRPARILTLLCAAALAGACGKSDDKAKKGAAGGATPAAQAAAVPAAGAAQAGKPGAQAPVQTSAKAVASSLNSLDAVRIGVASVQSAASYDAAAYPIATRFQDPRLAPPAKAASPDGKWLVWRDKDAQGYFLFLSKADGSEQTKLKDCKNGYQPSFSPDGKQILYTAMDWGAEQRGLYIYDLQRQKKRRCFTAALKLPRHQGLGGLAAWSADGSKIIFTYYDDLWMMNADGIGRALVNLAEPLKKPVTEAALLAWNKTGDGLVYQARGDASYHIVRLTNRI